jgi:hypothetical protein
MSYGGEAAAAQLASLLDALHAARGGSGGGSGSGSDSGSSASFRPTSLTRALAPSLNAASARWSERDECGCVFSVSLVACELPHSADEAAATAGVFQLGARLAQAARQRGSSDGGASGGNATAGRLGGAFPLLPPCELGGGTGAEIPGGVGGSDDGGLPSQLLTPAAAAAAAVAAVDRAAAVPFSQALSALQRPASQQQLGKRGSRGGAAQGVFDGTQRRLSSSSSGRQRPFGAAPATAPVSRKRLSSSSRGTPTAAAAARGGQAARRTSRPRLPLHAPVESVTGEGLVTPRGDWALGLRS